MNRTMQSHLIEILEDAPLNVKSLRNIFMWAWASGASGPDLSAPTGAMKLMQELQQRNHLMPSSSIIHICCEEVNE